MPPSPLAAPPVDTIEQVLERLHDIQEFTRRHEPLRRKDGVACFNYLYRIITQQVSDDANGTGFEDPTFIRELDVAFANRYLDALRADHETPGSGPKVWQALIDARSNHHVGPLRFAISGVNAHINFDLAFALLGACRKLGQPLEHKQHHAAYQKINGIFHHHMRRLRQHFEDDLERTVDDLVLSRFATVCGDAAVVVTRDVAWMNAVWMWPRRRALPVIDRHEREMDYLAALVNHAILFPVPW